MTITRGFIITILSGLAGTLIGAGIGCLLGRFAPAYFHFLFSHQRFAHIDHIEAGIALATLQGLGLGFLTGLVVVGATAWYNSRSTRDRQA